MSVKLALVGLVMALLAACGLYVMKDRVSQLEGELARQQGLLAVEQSQLYRLRAEWAMLERPARLARLAAEHLDLAPAHPTQIMTVADLPRRDSSILPGDSCARAAVRGGDRFPPEAAVVAARAPGQGRAS